MSFSSFIISLRKGFITSSTFCSNANLCFGDASVGGGTGGTGFPTIPQEGGKSQQGANLPEVHEKKNILPHKCLDIDTSQ